MTSRQRPGFDPENLVSGDICVIHFGTGNTTRAEFVRRTRNPDWFIVRRCNHMSAAGHSSLFASTVRPLSAVSSARTEIGPLTQERHGKAGDAYLRGELQPLLALYPIGPIRDWPHRR